MSKKIKMPSRKTGGVYSPCMETVLINTIESEINKLKVNIGICKADHLKDGNKDLENIPNWRLFEINKLQEKVNTLLYYQEKAKKKIYKRRNK